MFSALFLDYYRQWCAVKKPCTPCPPELPCVASCPPPAPPHLDFVVECNSDRYGVETIKGLYKRVVSIRIWKCNGTCFEPCQKFSACQFHGSFFANIKLTDYKCDGLKDIVAGVYDADSFPVGKLLLVNKCNKSCHHSDVCLPKHQYPYQISDNCIHIC